MVTLSSEEIDFLSLRQSVIDYFRIHSGWVHTSDVQRQLSKRGCLGSSVARCIRSLAAESLLIRGEIGYYRYR